MTGKSWAALIVAVVLAGAGAGYYWWTQRSAVAPVPSALQEAAPQAAAPTPIAPPPASLPVPAIRHPLPAAPAADLPELDRSDRPFLDALREFMDRRWFALFISDGMIRRIVATVDNLPRARLPAGTMPLKPPAGRFLATGSGADLTISPRNAARYLPYVRLVQSVDTGRLARVYIAFYPLFQHAYEELGDPRAYFNDRVVEAIDDLLAAPEPTQPPRLVRSGAHFRFADAAFDGLSAGRKMMLRMGGANAGIVKAKLREFRREVATGDGG